MENAQRSWSVLLVFPSRIPAGKGFQLLSIIEEKFHLRIHATAVIVLCPLVIAESGCFFRLGSLQYGSG